MSGWEGVSPEVAELLQDVRRRKEERRQRYARHLREKTAEAGGPDALAARLVAALDLPENRPRGTAGES